MKRKLFLSVAIVVLSARSAFGYIPVMIDAIVDPFFLESQASQLANVIATAKQTYDMYLEAQKLNKMMGDPKKALSVMIDTRALTDDINARLSGGTSYLSGIPGVDATQAFMHQLDGGVQIRLRLLPGDPGAAAKDDARLDDERKVVMQDGTPVTPDADLYKRLDEAEAIARSAKAALNAQARAREQAGKAITKINEAMKNASTESEKQALAAQYAAMSAQLAALNGQTQQEAYEYQLQKDRDQRLADGEHLTDQQQAVTDASATTGASDAQAALAEQNAVAARTLVQGNPIDLDYSAIK